jgi:hypothetical protein
MNRFRAIAGVLVAAAIVVVVLALTGGGTKKTRRQRRDPGPAGATSRYGAPASSTGASRAGTIIRRKRLRSVAC